MENTSRKLKIVDETPYRIIAWIMVYIMSATLFFGAGYVVATMLSRPADEGYNEEQTHYAMALDGYSYCPYCGESLKR